MFTTSHYCGATWFGLGKHTLVYICGRRVCEHWCVKYCEYVFVLTKQWNLLLFLFFRQRNISKRHSFSFIHWKWVILIVLAAFTFTILLRREEKERERNTIKFVEQHHVSCNSVVKQQMDPMELQCLFPLRDIFSELIQHNTGFTLFSCLPWYLYNRQSLLIFFTSSFHLLTHQNLLHPS